MPGHDIIVIGTSAGGVEVLSELVRGLPAGLPASLFVVCHFPPTSRSVLPEILSRSGRLLARHARDGEPIYPGHIYVAPPDHHLILKPDRVELSHGPRENMHRPAIDPLFRSAARHFGPRVVGVVLTGNLYDGVAGLLSIKRAGGITVVQDPSDAVVPALPQTASDIAGADHVVPAAGLAPLLTQLVQHPLPGKGGTSMHDPSEKLPNIIVGDMEAQIRGERQGEVTVFTCPECGGSLWQLDEQDLVRFNCHVGHAYHGEALLAEQAEALEAALWTAVRIFKDRSTLARQLANRERERGKAASAERFEEDAAVAERYSGLIQQYLLKGAGGTDVPPGAQAGPSEPHKQKP